jgi:hypothetical protein
MRAYFNVYVDDSLNTTWVILTIFGVSILITGIVQSKKNLTTSPLDKVVTKFSWIYFLSTFGFILIYLLTSEASRGACYGGEAEFCIGNGATYAPLMLIGVLLAYPILKSRVKKHFASKFGISVSEPPQQSEQKNL